MMSPGTSKPATSGHFQTSQPTFITLKAKVEFSFSNRPMQVLVMGRFENENSTYENRVAGSEVPISGRFVLPADSNDNAAPPVSAPTAIM
jgi:hypothetical protein